MKKIFVALFLLLAGSPAGAQTYGQVQWGLQKGTTTPNVVVFDGVTNIPIFSLDTVAHTFAFSSFNVTNLSIGTLAANTATISSNLTSPNATIGALTSTTSATGAFTSTTATIGALTGRTDGLTAAAGNIGEDVSSASVSMSVPNMSDSDLTNISLTAGTWKCYGSVSTLPAGTTTTTQIYGWITLVPTTLPAYPNAGGIAGMSFAAGLAGGSNSINFERMIKLTATTTVYLGGRVNFAVSTMNAIGFIECLRVQ